MLRRCLERNPRNRLRDIGEARVLLRNGAKWESDAVPARQRPYRNAVWPWVFGASGLAIAGLSWITLRNANAPPEPVRFTIPASASMPLQRPTTSPVLAVSRDGRQIAFTSSRALWLWTAQAGEPQRLEDTENAVAPFFAPEIWNSEREGRDLFLLDLKTGVTSRLTFDPIDAFQPTWSPDGRLLAFSRPTPGPPDVAVLSLDSWAPPRILLAAFA